MLNKGAEATKALQNNVIEASVADLNNAKSAARKELTNAISAFKTIDIVSTKPAKALIQTVSSSAY